MPERAGLLDYVNSENRLRYPEYRAPGSDKWQRISWEEAFSRIAKLMKADRDANFIEKNEQGVTVNRWLSTGMLCASGASNETGMLTQNLPAPRDAGGRQPGARLTRTNGSKSCSTFGRGAMTNHWVDIKTLTS